MADLKVTMTIVSFVFIVMLLGSYGRTEFTSYYWDSEKNLELQESLQEMKGLSALNPLKWFKFMTILLDVNQFNIITDMPLPITMLVILISLTGGYTILRFIRGISE